MIYPFHFSLQVDKRDKKYEVIQKGLDYKLIIKNITPEDAGEISSTYHEDFTKTTIIVSGIVPCSLAIYRYIAKSIFFLCSE